MSTGLVLKLLAQEKPAGRTDEEQQQIIEAAIAEATKQRVDMLAHKLLIRIEPLVNGVDIKEHIHADLVQRLEAPGAGAILVTIGYAYQSEANKKLKSFLGLGGFAASIREKGHKVSQTWKLAKSLVALNSAANKLESDEQAAAREARAQSGQGETEEEVIRRAQLEEQMLQQGISVLWKLGLIEIEDITRQACHKILHDHAHDVTHDLRQKRASALLKLGGWYQKLAKKYVKDAAGVLADLGAMDPNDLTRSSSSDTSSGAEASSSSSSALTRTSPPPAAAAAGKAPTPPPRADEAPAVPPRTNTAGDAPAVPPRPDERELPTADASRSAPAAEEPEHKPIILGAPPAQ